MHLAHLWRKDCLAVESGVWTEDCPIACAKKHLDGYGGVGHGYALGKSYGWEGDLLHARKIQVVFFHLPGGCGPADELSRGLGAGETAKKVPSKMVNAVVLPTLACACQQPRDEADTAHF